MARQTSYLNYMPYVLCVLSFVLILLILLAGVNNGLTQIYYLKTDTSGLSVASKLSNSTFLADLSAVAGADFVGQPSTAASLGIANSYTLSLLTSCGHFADGSISCAKPQIGFAFSPASELRLDSTSLQGTYSDEFLSALANYHKFSTFLAIGYIVAGFLQLLIPFIAPCTTRSRPMAVIVAILSILSTAVLLAAGIVAALTFNKLSKAIDNNFSSSGIRSSTNRIPTSLSFIAFMFSLFTAIILVVRACYPVSPRQRGGVGSRGLGDAKGGAFVTGEGPMDNGAIAAPPKPGLWSRVPTWNRHKYVQVEKQPAIVATNVGGHQEAVVFDSEDSRRRLDDDWAADDEYSHRGKNNDGASIPMLSLGGNKQTKDLNTAYEPYSSTTGGHS